MTYEEVKQLLDTNHITYITKNDCWMYGRATVGEISNVLLMPMFDDKTKEELDYITQCMKRMQVTAQKTSETFTDFIVGTFLDELQADPKTRTLLDETIPQYVVPKDFRFFPYEKTCPARKCNESKLRAYFNHMIEMNKIKPLYKSKNPDMVLTFYIDRAKRRLEDEIIEKTKYNPDTIQAADYALAELYNLYKPAFISFGDENRYSFGMFKAVIRHFIWHIKNKAIYGKNKEPIMLNISGEQGNGKTQFIRHLFKSVLGNLYVETSISVLNDDFGTNLLYDSWLLFFDELIRDCNTPDVDRLKQVITSTEIKSREIFTSHYVTTFVRSSFIGAANRPIYEVIDDPTGMRRYLNLEFTNPKLVHDKALHPLIDELWDKEGLAIWQSVDESRKHGYLVNEFAEMMEVAQRTYFSPNNSVYRFLHDKKIVIVTKGMKNAVTDHLDRLYNEQYLEYCNSHGILPQHRVSIENFKRRVKHIYDSKRGTTAKLANLRYVIGEVSTASLHPVLEDVASDNYEHVDLRDQIVIPDNYDQYKDFVPETIPEANIIIKLTAADQTEEDTEEETETPETDSAGTEAVEPEPTFSTNEKGQKVYEDISVAISEMKPSETVSLQLVGKLSEVCEEPASTTEAQTVETEAPTEEASAPESQVQTEETAEVEEAPESESHAQAEVEETPESESHDQTEVVEEQGPTEQTHEEDSAPFVGMTPDSIPPLAVILGEPEKSTEGEVEGQREGESGVDSTVKEVKLSELDAAIAREVETLEFKIHKIHRIHRKKLSYFSRIDDIKRKIDSSGFGDLSEYEFRIQAILMQEDLKAQFDTAASIEEIEAILKKESEAINNFTF